MILKKRFLPFPRHLSRSNFKGLLMNTFSGPETYFPFSFKEKRKYNKLIAQTEMRRFLVVLG